MPRAIGQTPEAAGPTRHAPSEGCQYRCLTCGNWLARRQEVRGHWALFSQGHGVFVDRRGRTYHQTVEGLHRRHWPTPEADHTRQEENINE